MKVYKYIVNQITPKGKYINVFEKVVQSKMSYLELVDYLADKYVGFEVSIEEIKEIETIGGTNKRTYMSYEHMYEHFMKLKFSLDYLEDEDFKKIIEMNKTLTDLKQKFSSRVFDEVKNAPRYKGITNKKVSVDLTRNYEKVSLSGEVMLRDLKLSEDNNDLSNI